MPVITIVIPHWNGKQHLDDCLHSLRQQTFTDFETVLVDNGSTDGSQSYIQANFPEVRLLELGENRGFTGACNAGIAHAHPGSQFIILLNNDTETHPDWLAYVINAFERHLQVGIIASKMLLFDRRDHFHNAGDFVRVDGIPGNRGVWQQDVGQFEQEEHVFSACGGSSAYRRTMLNEIGVLDDDFFFSCEDVDISWRAWLAGWQVLYVPQAIVYHKLKSTGGNVTGSYYDGRNFLCLLWKNYPTSLCRQNWRLILKAQMGITKEALQHWRGAASRARLRGQIAGILALPTMLRKRRTIQANRRITDEELMQCLTPVDDPPSQR